MLKNLVKVALFTAVFVFSISVFDVAPAFAQGEIGAVGGIGESIQNYVTDIRINQDSSIVVTENIAYDFGTQQRHGIFRTIPYKYKARGGTFKLRISNVKVVNDVGEDIPFATSTGGGELELKIGDPDKTVTGLQNYKIIYTVKRAINYFDDHDELYWNAIGTGWEIPIMKAETRVTAPAAISQVVCYTGIYGSTEQNCSIKDGNTNSVTFTVSGALDAGEGLTIVAGLPANTLAKPTTTQKIWDIIRDNGIVVLPIIVFGIMFYLWNKYGKDPKRKNSIVAQYESPDKMSPMYIASLLDNSVSNKAISAEVIYLAQQGYLTIDRRETTKLILLKGNDYQFSKVEKSTAGLPPQTKALLDDLFPAGKTEVLLSDLKDDRTFGGSLNIMKSKVITELVKDGYYKYNPSTVKALWLILGIVGTVFVTITSGNFFGPIGVLSGIISGIIVIVFGFLMPARTQKGVDTVAHIQGLEEYLTVAEKDRLKFHNAPEKNPQQFEILLPFAVALGVEAAWAAQFKDLTKAPSWYTDSTGNAFSAAAFSSSMNNFSGSMQSAVTSVTTSSSGGSGFSGGGSGGGGGGGGGGSW